MKLRLATATHNFKCVKITRICLILGPSICIFLSLNAPFVPNNSDFMAKKTTMVLLSGVRSYRLAFGIQGNNLLSKFQPFNPFSAGIDS